MGSRPFAACGVSLGGYVEVARGWPAPRSTRDGVLCLVEEAHHDAGGFLACGQDLAEFFAGGFEIGVGLFTRFADGLHFGFEFACRSFFVLEGIAEGLHGVTTGAVGTLTAALGAVGLLVTASVAASEGTHAAEPAAPTTGLGFLDLFEAGLDDFPFLIRDIEAFLHHLGHAFAHLLGVPVAAGATGAALGEGVGAGESDGGDGGRQAEEVLEFHVMRELLVFIGPGQIQLALRFSPRCSGR